MPPVAKNAGDDPATFHYAVSPSNTASLSPVPRMLYIASNGNVTVVDSGNTSVTYTNLVQGTVLRFRAIRIHTDSTASVIAWY